MLYILTGWDDFSLKEELGRIKNGLGDISLLKTNTSLLEGRKIAPGELEAVTRAAPFLAKKRLVIVEDLLSRFGTRKAAPGNGEVEGFTRVISWLPESTVLVLIDGEIKKSNPLYKEISAKAETKTFPQLKGAELSSWINERAKRRGGRMSPAATGLLSKLIGGDLWAMGSEIEKLALYTKGRPIE